MSDNKRFLDSLVESRFKFGLERIDYIAKKININLKDFYFIHVSGSNGKGSVCYFLSSILKEADIDFATFISPHIFSPTERILTNSGYISEEGFYYYLKEIEKISKAMDDKPSYFEALFGLFLLFIKEKKIPICIVEVGLEGKFDATNIIPSQIVIITTITKEHTDIFGNKLKFILNEAKEIAKDSTDFLISCIGRKDLKEILKKDAEIKRINFLFKNEDFWIKRKKISEKISYLLLYNQRETLIELTTKGDFQVDNSALAYLGGKLLKIDEKKIKEGLLKAKIPARFQIAKINNKKILIDVCHNPQGFSTFFRNFKLYFPDFKLRLLFTLLKDKDYKRITEIINKNKDLIGEIVVTGVENQRAQTPEILSNRIFFEKKKIIKNPKEAFLYLIDRLKDNEILGVCGSFYLVGAIEACLKSFPKAWLHPF